MTEEKNLTPKENNKEEELNAIKEKLDQVMPKGEKEEREKLELLRREEIRTMQKDIKKLREMEAEKERERIIGLERKKKKQKPAEKKEGSIPEPVDRQPAKKEIEEKKEKKVEDLEILERAEVMRREREKIEALERAKIIKEERGKAQNIEDEKERTKALQEVEAMEKAEKARREREKIESLERAKILEEKRGETKIPKRPEKEPKLETKKVIQEETPTGEIPAEEISQKETLIPKPPKKPSSLKKFLIRIGFVLCCVVAIGFTYWIINYRKIPPDLTPPQEEEPILPEEENPPQEEETIPPEEKPEVTIPPSLIQVEKTLTFEIAENEEIPSIIGQLGKEDLTENTFTRAVIKNTKENRLVDLDDIAETFQIETVSEVMEKLNKNEFDLLVYPQTQGKRGVLIIKIKDVDNLAESLGNWEAKITQEGLFISGNKIPTLYSSFKSFTFKEGPSIRYLTLSKEDLGVCYSLIGDYLILSTSFESVKEAALQLEESIDSSLQNKIGQLFIVGFDGKTITPQLEEFFKKYKPGGILLLSKNIESREQLKKLIQDLQSLSLKETGLPLLVAVDQEGDPVSRIGFLEEKTPQSEIQDTDGAYNVGLKRGQELKELGVNLNLAPLLDNMEEGDFYFDRSFQKNLELTGKLAKSMISGQKEAGILSAIKHFPGYVNVPFNPETKLAEIPVPEISQFQKAIEANPEMIMVSNAIYTDIDESLPFVFSQRAVLYLKTTLGAETLIISDDLAQNSLLEKFSLKDVVTKPIQSGVDLLVFSGWSVPTGQGMDAFLAAVKNKEVSEERINKIVSKITQLKEAL